MSAAILWSVYEAPPSRLSRARIAVSRELVRQLKSSPRLLAWLGAKRAVERDGRRFDPQAAAILRIDDLDGGSDLRDLSPAQARARFAEQLAIVDGVAPSGVATEERTFRGLGGTVHARLYWPEGLSGSQPAIIYFHGGGFMIGSIATHDGLCRRIALGARCRVISIEYRLAPEDPFPAAVDDGISAFRWVVEAADDLAVDRDRIALMGDSAGGNLSAVVALRTRGDAVRPALQVLLYPATDATCSRRSHDTMGTDFLLTRDMIDWYHQSYLGKDGELKKHPDVSPLLAPDVHGAPPALIYVAGFDPLRDEGRAYGERLEQAGVRAEVHELASLPHGFAQMGDAVDAARDAIVEIAHAVGKHLRTR